MDSNGDTTAGVTVPNTKLARDATELVRESTSDLIYNHSRRVYWFASLQGRNRGLSFDPELLYIGAMFHDLGLNQQFRGSGHRFEAGPGLSPPGRGSSGRNYLVRYRWTDWMTDEPSPTAAATRFIDPARTSPAANSPSTAVS
jgi:hypothetical protein